MTVSNQCSRSQVRGRDSVPCLSLQYCSSAALYIDYVINQTKCGCSSIRSRSRIQKSISQGNEELCFEMPWAKVGFCPAGRKPKAWQRCFRSVLPLIHCIPTHADTGCTQRAGFRRCRSRGAKEAKEAKGAAEVLQGRKRIQEVSVRTHDGPTRQAVCSDGAGGFQMPACRA